MTYLKNVLDIAGVIGVLLVLFITPIVITLKPWLLSPPTYRFSIPTETTLTEPIAVEFTKEALAADGKDSAMVRPIPFDNEGRFFAANTIDPNSGYVQWMTQQDSYGVQVEKKGQEIECRIYQLK
jgi:hypothetical protein